MLWQKNMVVIDANIVQRYILMIILNCHRRLQILLKGSQFFYQYKQRVKSYMFYKNFIMLNENK